MVNLYDETYPQLVMNYVKPNRKPKFDDGWSPVLDTLRAGDSFVTSGDRQIISLSDKAPFSSQKFRVPFEATGKK